MLNYLLMNIFAFTFGWFLLNLYLVVICAIVIAIYINIIESDHYAIEKKQKWLRYSKRMVTLIFISIGLWGVWLIFMPSCEQWVYLLHINRDVCFT